MKVHSHQRLQRKEIHVQKRMKWIDQLSLNDPMRQLICNCLQDLPDRRPIASDVNSELIRLARQHPKPFNNTIELLLQMVSFHISHYHDNGSAINALQLGTIII